ncbi:hypothetical protein HQQ80_02275 [Microbacteriaceae bacterium VKM Ac-2855]|nr:hypothetical protein [Microbacteriaceae bacterium VKM Ac-2855]
MADVTGVPGVDFPASVLRKVQYRGHWLSSDTPVLYLRTVMDAWDQVSVAGDAWLSQSPVDGVEVEGFFMNETLKTHTTVRLSGRVLRVTMHRPARSMLRTGDPAGLGLADVRAAVARVGKRLALPSTPSIAGLTPAALADALAHDRDLAEHFARVVEITQNRTDSLSPDLRSRLSFLLSDGMYSQALGELIRDEKPRDSLPETVRIEARRLRADLSERGLG